MFEISRLLLFFFRLIGNGIFFIIMIEVGMLSEIINGSVVVILNLFLLFIFLFVSFVVFFLFCLEFIGLRMLDLFVFVISLFFGGNFIIVLRIFGSLLSVVIMFLNLLVYFIII